MFINTPFVGLMMSLTVTASCLFLFIVREDERPQMPPSSAAAGPSKTAYCPEDEQCLINVTCLLLTV